MNATTGCSMVLLACVACFVFSLAELSRVTDELRRATVEALRICRLMEAPSPYARLLGRHVAAKKYESSEWERYVVVAVSWQGSLRLRKDSEVDRNGFWIHWDKVDTRVRTLDE